jgi:hypothetical protein
MSTAAKLEPAFITRENLDALLAAGKIANDTAVGWRDVRWTQLSIARFSGGAVVNGVEYEYMYGTDELVRRDVAKWIRAMWRKQKPAEPEQRDLLAPKRTSRKRRSSTARTERSKDE